MLGFPSAQSTERIPPTEVGGSFTPTYTRRNSIYANVLTATKRVLPLSCLKDIANDSLFYGEP
jgi:hypothetical protein